MSAQASSREIVTVAGKPLQRLEHNGQVLVTFRQIDEVHGKGKDSARRGFNKNRKHFEAGKDYFGTNGPEARQLGFTAPSGMIFLTETGYLKLVKTFEDDLAWKIQGQLVDCYFRRKETVPAPAVNLTKIMDVMTVMSQAVEMLAKETFVHINALRADIDELKQRIAAPAAIATSYTADWKPTHAITPTNPENVLYKQFMKVWPSGNLAAWHRSTGIKLSAFTVSKILYQDAKPSPATFATIAVALGFSKEEIKTHLQTNYKNCGFLALL